VPRGNQGSGGRDEKHQQQNSAIGFRIERFDAVQHVRDQAISTEAQNQACKTADSGNAETLENKAGHDLTAEGSEGEANAYFALTPTSKIAQCSIQTDTCQQERGTGEQG
jgi:hypothetical protein